MAIIVLILILGGILLTPIWLKLDTRIPLLEIDWRPIGSLRIWFKDEWILGGKILFFSFRSPLAEVIHPREKKTKRIHTHPKKNKWKKKIWPMLKSFRVESWECAFDSGDFAKNAQLYPLNFHPYTRSHLLVNFNHNNYLNLKIKNSIFNMILYMVR